MLPDFPFLKEKLSRFVTQHMRRIAGQDPVLQFIKTERHFEGNRLSNQDVNGKKHESAYQSLESQFNIARQDVITKGIAVYIEAAEKVAEDIKRKQVQALFDVITKATQEAGNVVSGGGKPFSIDLFLEALEKTEIDFDNDGKPDLPSLFIHPDQKETALKVKLRPHKGGGISEFKGGLFGPFIVFPLVSYVSPDDR